jgi:hypothetical protein
MKYKVDEWVIYRPFADAESELLREMQNRALILWVYPKSDFYDYDIYIEDTGKKKKVRELHLFPERPPTY